MNERIKKEVYKLLDALILTRVISTEEFINELEELFERDRDKIRGILEKACDYCDLIPMDCIKSCEILLDKLMTEDIFVGGDNNNENE